MIEALRNFDLHWFFAINNGLSNDVFDFLMPLIRNKFTWVPLYLFAVFFLLTNYKKDGWRIIAITLLLILASDQLTATVLKPLFSRLRPCHNALIAGKVHLLVDCGAGFSMPSNHAANHFALATYLGLVFFHRTRSMLLVLLLWAALVCVAQIYVGVHYPLDVMVGGIIGIKLGMLAAYISKKLLTPGFYSPRYALPPPRKRRSSHRSSTDSNTLTTQPQDNSDL
jgi:undecaprenyl-diphosphatase